MKSRSSATQALPTAEPLVEALPTTKATKRNWTHLLLLLPALGFLAILFVYPLIGVLMQSFTTEAGNFTLENYQRAVGRSLYLRVYWITIQIAFVVTLLTLLLAYPLAYVLSTVRQKVANVLLVFVLVPFFTSLLVRTYSWMVILGPEGILNQGLQSIGLPGVTLLYNRAGVIIGMVYALLPYMVLTLYSVMRGIDRNLLQAAANLGAGRWQAFRRVFFPLSLPGVTGGSLLVFILSLGYFITPRLLGGNRDQMIAMIIDYYTELALDWHFASALAGVLLLITLIGFAIFNRLVGLQSLFESKI